MENELYLKLDRWLGNAFQKADKKFGNLNLQYRGKTQLRDDFFGLSYALKNMRNEVIYKINLIYLKEDDWQFELYTPDNQILSTSPFIFALPASDEEVDDFIGNLADRIIQYINAIL